MRRRGHRTAMCPGLPPPLRQGTWGTVSWEQHSPKLFPSPEHRTSCICTERQSPGWPGQITALGTQSGKTLLPAAAPGGGTSRSSTRRGRQSGREAHEPPPRAAAGPRNGFPVQPHTQLTEIHRCTAQRNTSYLGNFNYLLQVIKCL